MDLIVDVAAAKMQEFKKDLLVLRSMLKARRFFRALIALEFAMRYHGAGFRKDGVTPEMHHQVTMALMALLLPDLIDPEGTVVVILWHDTDEDYGVERHMFVERFPAVDRASVLPLANSAILLNKYNRDGSPKDEEALYAEMGRDQYASIVKPIDRFHNLSTMNAEREDGEPVFSYEKQGQYADFAERRIYPLLKAGQSYFPHQDNAYELVKRVLKVQVGFVRAVQRASTRSTRRIEIAASRNG